MQKLLLPKLKKNASDATVTKWLVAIGQNVSKGDVLVELQSVKDIVTVAAPADGSVASVAADKGATVKPGDVLAEFAASGEAATPAAPASKPAAASGAAGGDASKATPVLMPKAGNTMEEGTIVSWKVAVGDTVAVGDIIFEIETDKATVEVEADAAGRVAKIVAEEGDIIPVQDPVAVLADNDADADAWLAANGGGAGADADSGSAAPAQADSAKSAAASTSGDSSKATPVLMPKAGNTMEEGTIVSWNVSVGDTVAVGDIIFEIETDKATVEVEADAAGRVAKIVAAEGDIIPVQAPVAVLADNDDDAEAWLAENGASAAEAPAAPASPAPAKPAAPAAPAAPAKPAAPVKPATAAPARSAAKSAASKTDSGRVKASPAARRMAGEKGVNLSAIATGSGPAGRIITDDVAAAPAGGAAAITPIEIEPANVVVGQKVKHPLGNMRKAIATNLQVSKQTIPHFYIETEVVADAALAFYRTEKLKYKCSINDVIVQACGIAINEFPAFRSSYGNGEIIEQANSNIGIAVGMDDGLVVPVVVGVEQMTLGQSALETARVIEAARNGKIENMGKGVFTISNLGMFGVTRFSAIINPPEAAILAVGAALEKVVVTDGAMKAARVMTLTLSCDHRVVDGLVAAQFLARVKEILESPAEFIS